MNTGHYDLKTLKRMCREAADILIRDHKYWRDSFYPADGDESIGAPALLQKRFKRGHWMNQVAKGTLLYQDPSDYYGEGGDVHLPTEVLDELLYWESPEAAASIREMLAEEPQVADAAARSATEPKSEPCDHGIDRSKQFCEECRLNEDSEAEMPGGFNA